MPGLTEGRVAIVTGAGRGIGRGHALELARQGAKVVVNDLGTEVDGQGSSEGPAGAVVDEIRAAGGEAVANGDDVSDWDGAGRLVQTAVRSFGSLDVVVNNAGILRDRMLANMSMEEWDAVIRVHLRGTFATMRRSAEYWRDRTKAGETNDARIINTTSASGLFGNVGQTNYGAAKGGIAAMTIIAASELGRYGVTVNAIAPGAYTRMSEQAKPGSRAPVAAGYLRRLRPGEHRSPGRLAGQPRIVGRHGTGVQRARWSDTGAGRVARRAVGGRRSALGARRARLRRDPTRRGGHAARGPVGRAPEPERVATRAAAAPASDLAGPVLRVAQHLVERLARVEARFAWEPQGAFADHVALRLVGPTGNGCASRPQIGQ